MIGEETLAIDAQRKQNIDANIFCWRKRTHITVSIYSQCTIFDIQIGSSLSISVLPPPVGVSLALCTHPIL